MKSVKDIVSRFRLIGDESSEDEATDEVIRLSAVAIRMSVTNKAVIAMLREKANPDIQWYKTAVREELRALRDEKIRDSDWLQGEIKIAQGRSGRARDSQDFRSVDVKHLKRRRNVVLAVADRLEQLAQDEKFLGVEARACRERTRADVREAIETIATRSVHPDPLLSLEERQRRMGDLGRDLMSELLERERAAATQTEVTRPTEGKSEKSTKRSKSAKPAAP